MTSPAPSGGSSPMRIGGLALIGLALVAALVGLLTLGPGGDSVDQALAPTSSPDAVPPPADGAVPPPADGAAPPTDGAAPPADGSGAASPDVSVPGPGAPGPTDEPIAPYTPPAPPYVPPATGDTADIPPATGDTGDTPPARADTGDTPPATADTGDTPPATAYTPPGGESKLSGSVSAARAPLRVYNNSTIKGLGERAAEDFRDAGWEVKSVGNYSQGVIPTSTVYYQAGNKSAAEALASDFGMRARPRFDGLEQASDGLIVIVTRDYEGSDKK